MGTDKGDQENHRSYRLSAGSAVCGLLGSRCSPSDGCAGEPTASQPGTFTFSLVPATPDMSPEMPPRTDDVCLAPRAVLGGARAAS